MEDGDGIVPADAARPSMRPFGAARPVSCQAPDDTGVTECREMTTRGGFGGIDIVTSTSSGELKRWRG
jgi:hypothetical protein